MPQVTLYLPDEVALRLRREAKRARKSVSAFMVELAMRRLAPTDWPDGFARLYGSWQGDFPVLEDSPPDEVERMA